MFRALLPGGLQICRSGLGCASLGRLRAGGVRAGRVKVGNVQPPVFGVCGSSSEPVSGWREGRAWLLTAMRPR